jgi:chitodextrinase
VQVRWAFAADGATTDIGWFVDNIDISDDGGSLFSNDGTTAGGMIAERLGPGEQGAWVELGTYGDEAGAGSLERFSLTENTIGAPGDTFGIRLHAVYDGDDVDDDGDQTADWGFEVSDVLVMFYTRMNLDIGVTFADLGDSVFTEGGFIEVGQTYDIVARASNLGLSDVTIFNTHAVVENAIGNEVYHRFVYTYAPGQGDTLFMYPDYQDFNDTEAFYNFPDFTPVEEGDYTLLVYTDIFGGDDDTSNDTLAIPFHAYTTQPTFVEDFNIATDSSLFADGWEYEQTQGDTSFFIGDLFGEGDTEIWWYTGIAYTDSMDETVITPPIDLSGTTGNALAFEQYLNNTATFGPDGAWTLNILGRPDGETAWTVLNSVNGATAYALRYAHYTLDISAFDGETAFQAGFQFKMSVPDSMSHTPTGYATIDDVVIYANADLAAPAAPTSVVAESGDREAFLTWADAGDDVMFYTVYVADTTDADSAGYFADLEGPEEMFVAADLVNDSTYYFFVSATDFNGNESALSDAAEVTPADVDAPTAVMDLMVTNSSPTSAFLTWSAPFESWPEEGSYYEVRMSDAMIIDGDTDLGVTGWEDAELVFVSDSGAVAAEGEPEEIMVKGLTPGIDTYFALRTTDEVGNVSELSNVVNNDDVPPARVSDLHVVDFDDASISFAWTTSGDDGNVGTATEFDMRVAFGTAMDWDIAVPLADLPMPAAAGTEQAYTASEDVYPSFALTFALVVIDNNDNVSEISNVVVWRPDGVVPPEITEVVDIPDDQGHQVRVSWTRSDNEGDAGTMNVTSYGLWRLIPDAMSAPGIEAAPATPMTVVSGYLELFETASEAEIGERFRVMNPDNTINSEWDFIALIPAHDDAMYHYVAPTLMDAVPTTFMASAHSELGFVGNSAPVAGTSTDDLAPSQVAGLDYTTTSDPHVQLFWDENADEYLDADLAAYIIYRDGVEIGQSELAEFLDTDVAEGSEYTYIVTAVDFTGNESVESEELLVSLVSVTAEAALPEAFALSQNFPNPFNPVTQITFALPEDADVVLTVYNMLGQEIKQLADGHFQAGYHTVAWNATDNGNRRVPSGVYFYHIQASNFNRTMKMVLLK